MTAPPEVSRRVEIDRQTRAQQKEQSDSLLCGAESADLQRFRRARADREELELAARRVELGLPSERLPGLRDLIAKQIPALTVQADALAWEYVHCGGDESRLTAIRYRAQAEILRELLLIADGKSQS